MQRFYYNTCKTYLIDRAGETSVQKPDNGLKVFFTQIVHPTGMEAEQPHAVNEDSNVEGELYVPIVGRKLAALFDQGGEGRERHELVELCDDRAEARLLKVGESGKLDKTHDTFKPAKAFAWDG